MTEFNKKRLMESPDYPKVQDILELLIECRDALPAISMTAARLHYISLTLGDRIDECLEPWATTESDPEGE